MSNNGLTLVERLSIGAAAIMADDQTRDYRFEYLEDNSVRIFPITDVVQNRGYREWSALTVRGNEIYGDTKFVFELTKKANYMLERYIK